MIHTKRDLDLIRDILLAVEASDRSLLVSDIRIPEHTTGEITFHAELLADAGYIEYSSVNSLPHVNYVIHRLTMKGYDYLDSIRNELVWKCTLSKIVRAVGSAPMDIIRDVALKIIRDRLGL